MSDPAPPIDSMVDQSSPTDSVRRARRAVRLAAIATGWIALIGTLAIPSVSKFELRYASLFYEQFAKIELPALTLVGLFAIATLVAMVGAGRNQPLSEDWSAGPVRRPEMWAIVFAAAVLIVTLAGTDLIFHRFFLADDEYAAWFQAVIFAHGRWNAVVSPEWCRWIRNLTPNSIGHPATCSWHLTFLPIHSLVRAAFIAMGADRFAGPVVAAVSVVLVGVIARRSWPDRPRRAWIAMFVLAVSTQFLVTSMTMYAMTTHLLFSLIWLWMYLVDRRWSVVALPLVGVLAMGVHSPLPHLLFIPPFVFRYIRQRRFATAAYMGVVYAIGLVFWKAQYVGGGGVLAPVNTQSVANTAYHLRTFLMLPSALSLYTSAMHLALAATWNSPVAVVCVVAACLAWRNLDAFSRDCAMSLVVTVVVRAFSGDALQGEGWGYRYIYAGLGNFALLAACGFDVLAVALGARRAVALLATSLITSVAVELPLRAVQVQAIIGPYYRAYEYMSHLPAKVVIFPSGDFMWGRQLVRNDPFLRQAPFILDMQVHSDALPGACQARDASGATSGGGRLAAGNAEPDSATVRKLCALIQTSLERWTGTELLRLYPGQVHVIRVEELTSFGLAPTRFHLMPIIVDPSSLSGTMPPN